MSDMHFLLPKTWVALCWCASAVTMIGVSASYHDTITLGSIIVAAVVVILGGLFTLRNNLKSFWKDLAEERGEQVKVLQDHLKKAASDLVAAEQRHTDQMGAFAEEQREVRHQLKTELSSLAARLEVERSKHDLTSVIERLTSLEAQFDQRTPMFERMDETLTQILAVLKQQAFPKEEPHAA